MLSTVHTGKVMDSSKVNRRGERVKKPDCVIDYNQHMCGVDHMDQLMAYYTIVVRNLLLNHVQLAVNLDSCEYAF